MAMVEGSLIFFPNRCECIAISCSCLGRSGETLAHTTEANHLKWIASVILLLLLFDK